MKKIEILGHRKFRSLRASLCLTFSMLSLISVGFCSWVLNSSAITNPIIVSVGDVQTTSVFGRSAVYVKGSEHGFEYEVFNDAYNFTDTSFSLLFKIRPDLLKASFSGQDISAYFGIKYVSTSGVNYFDSSNGYFVVPSNFICKQEDTFNSLLYSGVLSYTTALNNNQTTYELGADILLYSETKLSLYSVSKYYQSSTEYIYFNVVFDFDTIASKDYSDFLSTTFKFVTSLGGVSE